ncbi:KUNITZ TRYPSIN INHIBITOR 2 [Salix koriyanagi]|uniref:KUNITZ TRYPSIN INHIBITOR 2 n=1 Tax=Salix koriyanagi TaxID=2511006 RepID=A0A9Q0UYF8_9ROSI|nr:KUNITZ TRYPSIN INHIBITOR 2 [Salix koriyanagi]
MKSTLLVSFSFLLLAFAFTKPSTAGDLDATEAVLDTDGEKLRAGAEYYILPLIRGRGGGLTMASTRDESCPLDVVQEPLEISEGLPVTFSPCESQERSHPCLD